MTSVAKIIFNQAHRKSFEPTFYQHAKNQAISSFCSRDKVDLKILQSDWPTRFCPISQEPNFSQIWDLCRDTENSKFFHYRTSSQNINDQIFQ